MIVRRNGSKFQLLATSAAALAIALAAPAQAQITPAPAPAPAPAETGDAGAAQDTAPDPGAAAETGRATDAGEVVVTARKRSENLRDVPIAITALTGALLTEKNVSRLTDLTAVIPNFQLSLAAAAPLAYVRGFGTGVGPSFDQSVGKFVDNVSFGRDFDARLPLYDTAQFELLKGPQVLLYGNSATVAAMNITSRKPSGRFEGNISAAYEFVNDETYIEGGISAPLAEGASVRVAGFYQDLAKGWIYNVALDRFEPKLHNFGIRTTVRLDPASNVRVLLKAEVNRIRDIGSTGQPIRQSTVPARQYADAALDLNRNVNYRGAPFFSDEGAKVHADVYQADISWDVGGGTLASTTAVRDATAYTAASNAVPQPIILVSFGQKYRQTSQELRYSGKTGTIDYLVGGYYEHGKLDLFGLQNLNGPAYGLPLPLFNRLTTLFQKTNSYSGFADVTWHATPTFSIEAGARYTHIEKTSDQGANATNFIPNASFDLTRRQVVGQINPAYNGLLTSVFGSIAHRFTDIKQDDDFFQPQVILQYKPDRDLMVYGKYVKGFKAGGVDYAYGGSVASGVSPAAAQFAPEKAESFELGVKGITPNRRLEYALNLFNTTFTDLQTSVFVGTTLFTTNVGRARSRGAELDLTFRPTSSLTLTAVGAYLDARFLSYPNSVCTVAQTLATPAGTLCQQDLSGRRTPFGSKWSGNVGARYDRDVGDLRATLGVSATARSAFNTAINDDPLGVQKGFASIDAHLDLGQPDGRWVLSLFGRNLTRVNYKEYSVATPLAPGGFNTFLSRGRQIGIRATSKF